MLSEDPDMRKAILDTGRSLKKIYFGVSLFLVFLANRKGFYSD